MPDLCIVYQLHLECGRLINLFDWLCSFVSVVDPAATEKLTNQEGGRGRKEDIDPTLQYLFNPFLTDSIAQASIFRSVLFFLHYTLELDSFRLYQSYSC